MTDINPLPLSCLLSKTRTKDTEQVREDLISRGWTFLYKDDQTKLKELPTTEIVQKYLKDINKGFFNLDQTQKDEYKQIVYPENRFGYFTTGRKEGYRFATGSKMREFILPCVNKPSPYHKNLSKIQKIYVPFHIIAAACDEICSQICQNQGQFLFNNNEHDTDSSSSVSFKDIPLLNGQYQSHKFDTLDYYSDHPPLTNDSLQSFGLFDIVKYRPKNLFPEEFTSTDSQVDSHADPGLFSLSLGSTAEGLELFDPSKNEWIKAPLHVMVLWCGHAVTEVSGGKVKPGVHRVVANDSERMTCWYEVCVEEQMPKRKFDMNNEMIAREKELWAQEYRNKYE